MSTDVLQLLNRIKNLQEFQVILDMPDEFMFQGQVPWDMKVVDRTVTVKILASTQEEADNKVFEYFYK
jgi:hypothetical protein